MLKICEVHPLTNRKTNKINNENLLYIRFQDISIFQVFHTKPFRKDRKPDRQFLNFILLPTQCTRQKDIFTKF